VLCNSEEALSHPGTVGRPIAGADVRVLDEYDRIVPPGVTGVIYGKAMDGWPDFTYIGHDDKRRAIERDGYITVGDIGHLDEDGFLYLSDRMNDMVISGGVNIYPAEIEGCLSRMDGIADAAVFGIPDRDFGEALAAHVELLAGASISADDVRAFVAANLAKYKVPRVVVFEDRLPREDTGKLFKRRLKEPYWRQPA
jgi:long-chain acyl-CoA synthetase